jgi:hypothetical protein
MEIILAFIALAVAFWAFFWVSDNVRRAHLYDTYKPRIDTFDNDKKVWAKKVETEKVELEILAKEKSKGFPWLANAYAEYHHLKDMEEARWLESKSHPAKKAADKVKEIAHSKRETEKLWRTLKYQLEYYESLFPWLTDFQDDDIDDLVRQVVQNRSNGNYDSNNDENIDPAKRWLSDGEYKSLSTADKYQRALDRYRSRPKSRWEIGRDYERFAGYQYEKQGWQVKYQGIVEGFSDLGRDLILTRNNSVIIVQCKNWARFKTIHEKHIFQLYGTAIAYQIDNPGKIVNATFVTSTVLSERAKQFANALKIQYQELMPLKEYPCIKCNISKKDGEKIYHLPFDQQYDATIIDTNLGEKFVSTINEAESLGFRRAFRWRGNA